MELGEFVFLAKGGFGRLLPAPAELNLNFKGQGRKGNLQLLWRPQQVDGTPQILAVVDRQLTNQDPQLPQNHVGVSNPAGQLLSVVGAGLADLQVISASVASPDVLAVRVSVHLLPAAFDVMVPEQTSRAVAYLDDGAAAAAAAATVAGSLLEVVNLLHLCRAADQLGEAGARILEPGEGGSSGGVEEGADGAAAAAAASAASGGVAEEDAEQQQQQYYNDVRDEIFDIVAPRDWHSAQLDPQGGERKGVWVEG
ncbi:hypothetical protein Vretimale_18260 [Volvox reticuliferus]|uniref:Uncharacterized protein n=1 Tax=Volvox reticuliferus TaxID=1737510 RepID=A0A8J4CWY3_9CHLO|nr:hypothetical protein Vretifemale_18027 [Volvox reticuliferus]GIM15481.1 hypothetical protein Vretimale_18260 [Volvox reticuliferus]